MMLRVTSTAASQSGAIGCTWKQTMRICFASMRVPGHLIWDIAYADANKNYGATSAPLLVKGKIIVGTSGGDDGVRGFIAAFDATTGAEVWRRWTIPAPGEFGSSSWPGDLYLHGGGTGWMPGTFDPELNTLYWGTGNAAPDYDGSVRPGDDLYTACVLALDPDTGKYQVVLSVHAA